MSKNANLNYYCPILHTITKTCLHNFDPLKPQFYIVYISFLIFAQKQIVGTRKNRLDKVVLRVPTIYVLNRNMKNIEFLSENLVFQNQHGFWSCLSCKTQLIQFQNQHGLWSYLSRLSSGPYFSCFSYFSLLFFVSLLFPTFFWKCPTIPTF